MGVEGFVSIACCPDHGLHGSRERCFVCGGDVEQIPMVPCDDAAVRRGAKAVEELLEGAASWVEIAEAVLRAAGGQDVS
jgi:hypothetical protein